MSLINTHFFKMLYLSFILLKFAHSSIVNGNSSKEKKVEDHIGKDEFPNNSNSLVIEDKLINFNSTDKEKNGIMSDKMYLDIKCKCADLIYNLLKLVNSSLCLNDNIAITLLKKLNKRITSTLNKLFLYRDKVLDSNISEPFFLKFLLSFYFYIYSLIHVNNQHDPTVNDSVDMNNEVNIVRNEDTISIPFTDHLINQHETLSGKETTSYTSESVDIVSGNTVDEDTNGEIKISQSIDNDQDIVLENDKISEKNKINSFETDDDIFIDINKDNYENEFGAVIISDGKKIHRVILQIMNLIQRFMIEFCHYNIKNNNDFNTIKNEKGNDNIDQDNKNIIDRENINRNDDSISFMKSHDNNINTLKNNIKSDFDEQLNNLDYILEQITFSPEKTSETEIHINKILLKTCIKGTVENENANYIEVCNNMLSVPHIQIQIQQNIINKSFDDFLKLIEKSYDIKIIYNYLETIFNVIMKIIYQKTIETLNRHEVLDFEYCEKVVLQLKLMNCPIDLITHFTLLLNITEFKKSSNGDNQIFADLVQNVFNPRLTHILRYSNLIDGKKISKLSLQNFMNTVLDVSFKQYWWIFNLLKMESEKSSYYIYDTSLHLFPKNVFFRSERERKEYDYKCNALTEMYNNFLHLKNIYNECLQVDNVNQFHDITKYFKKIRNNNLLFVSYLVKILDKWSETSHLSYDVDLLDIFMTTIIHLRNNYNLKINTYGPKFKMRLLAVQRFVILKQKKLNRIVDFIFNLLDNYQYRHCINIKCRLDIHKNKNKNYIEPLDLLKIPRTVYEKNEDLNIDHSSKQITSNDPFNNASDAAANFNNHDLADILNENHCITYDFYYISQLLTASMPSSLKEIFGTDIYFDWYGKSKNIHQIQVNVMYDMLNTYELVDYQNVYVKWLVASMLATWNEVLLCIKTDDIEILKEYVITVFDLLQYIVSFNDSLGVDKTYKGNLWLYLNLFYSLSSNYKSPTLKFNLLNSMFLKPVYKILGVVKVNKPKLDKIASTFKISNPDDKISILKELIKTIEKYSKNIEDNFLFLDRRNKLLEYKKRLLTIFLKN